jgi:hypothetical protein
VLSIKNVVDLYVENVIEDKHIVDEQSKKKKVVKGSRAIKGQIETRRTLYIDVVGSIGEKAAVEITCKDVVSLIKGIIDRGAQVQAGKVLSELTAAYEYCIGLDYFSDTFANSGLLAKSSLKQNRVKLTANNAVGSLIEAMNAGSPVLHLTGQVEREYLDRDASFIHETKDQLTFLRALSKTAFRITSSDNAVGVIRVATTVPMGPVSVELSIDVQAAGIDLPLDLRSNETKTYSVEFPENIIQIDANPVAQQRN